MTKSFLILIFAVIGLFSEIQSQTTCDLLRGLILNEANNAGANDVVLNSGGISLLPSMINGNLYVMNGTTAIVPPAFSSQGNIALFDSSVLFGEDVEVEVMQAFPNQFRWYTFDNSQLGFSRANISHGPADDFLLPGILCHTSTTTLSEVDYQQRGGGVFAPFMFEQSQFTLLGGRQPLIEITVSENASFVATDTSNVNAYFYVTAPVISGPATLDFRPAFTGSNTIQLANGLTMSMNFSNTDVFFATWILEGGDLVLQDSFTALFLQLDSATISGLQPGVIFADETLDFGSAQVQLINTNILIWNVYGEAMNGVYQISDSLLGETTCRSNAICTLVNCTLDGSGGFVTAADDSSMTHQDGLFATFLVAQDQSTVRLVRMEFDGAAADPARLSANGNAVIIIEDSPSLVTTGPAAYTLEANGNSQILVANIQSPMEGERIEVCEGNSEIQVAFTAQVVSASGMGSLQVLENDVEVYSQEGGPFASSFSYTPSVGLNSLRLVVNGQATSERSFTAACSSSSSASHIAAGSLTFSLTALSFFFW